MCRLEEYFKEDETLVTVELIEYKTFKEKIRKIKEFTGKASIEILEDRYIYLVRLEGEHGGKTNKSKKLQSS